MNEDDCEAEQDDLRAEARADRRYQMELRRHPDCRDPDHPGCEDCQEQEDDEDVVINEEPDPYDDNVDGQPATLNNSPHENISDYELEDCENDQHKHT